MINYHYQHDYKIVIGGLFYVEISMFNEAHLWVSYHPHMDGSVKNYSFAQYGFRIKTVKK